MKININHYLLVVAYLCLVLHAFQISISDIFNSKSLVRQFPLDLTEIQRDELRLSDADLRRLCEDVDPDSVGEISLTSTGGILFGLPFPTTFWQTHEHNASDLFRNIRVGGDWSNAAKQLNFILDCPGAHPHVE